MTWWVGDAEVADSSEAEWVATAGNHTVRVDVASDCGSGSDGVTIEVNDPTFYRADTLALKSGDWHRPSVAGDGTFWAHTATLALGP